MSNTVTKQYLSQAAAMVGTGLKPMPNVPNQYKSRQHRYMAERLDRFAEARAYLADDYVSAQVQGLTADFYAYTDVDIRLSDVTTDRVTAFFDKRADDFKRVLLPPRCLEYIPTGAKLQAMGSTWICVNPSNLSSANASAVIARCNATYNSYDDYGNIVTEPICVQKADMVANRNESHQNMVLAEGYYTVLCQLNEVTRKLYLNKRIVLGERAFFLTGLTDFIQEFTGDRESAHLLAFTARLDETTAADDVTDKFIANGNNYSFGAQITGAADLHVGQTAKLNVTFLANGEEKQPSDSLPLTWTWETTAPDTVTVDSTGQITALSEGTATITARLSENKGIAASAVVTVSGTAGQPYVAFTGIVPTAVEQFNVTTVSAALFEGNTETDKPLQWSFAGANPACYYASVDESGKTATISCISPSAAPLEISAHSGEYGAKIYLSLEGL